MTELDAPTADLAGLPVLYQEDEAARFSRRVREWVTRIVWISDRVPGVNAIEDDLSHLLALIQGAPGQQSAAELEFARYLQRLDEPSPDHALVEILEYCMATLRYPSVLTLSIELRDAAATRYEGGLLMAWDAMRRYDRVIEAFSDHWEGADIYRRYRRV